MKYKVNICGEMHLAVTHNLLCSSGNIEGHPNRGLSLPALGAVPELAAQEPAQHSHLGCFFHRTAAQMAANNPNIGAIASSLAINTYGLQVVVPGIEDYQGNTTRFLVIGSKSPKKSGCDKTSILIGSGSSPGALNEILTILSAKNIDLAKIESRPTKDKQWKYHFFLDMIGHIEDPVINEACNILKQICAYLELLGSYPRADDINLNGELS